MVGDVDASHAPAHNSSASASRAWRHVLRSVLSIHHLGILLTGWSIRDTLNGCRDLWHEIVKDGNCTRPPHQFFMFVSIVDSDSLLFHLYGIEIVWLRDGDTRPLDFSPAPT
jgi:hypothetical protein